MKHGHDGHPACWMWGDGMDLMNKYPRLTDLEAPAARRIPKFVFAYLDSGTGKTMPKTITGRTLMVLN